MGGPPVSDTQLFALIVLSCAVGVTAHLAIVWQLAAHAPRWRSLLALLVPPLTLFFGIRARSFVTTAVWAVAWIVYFGARMRA